MDTTLKISVPLLCFAVITGCGTADSPVPPGGANGGSFVANASAECAAEYQECLDDGVDEQTCEEELADCESYAEEDNRDFGDGNEQLDDDEQDDYTDCSLDGMCTDELGSCIQCGSDQCPCHDVNLFCGSCENDDNYYSANGEQDWTCAEIKTVCDDAAKKTSGTQKAVNRLACEVAAPMCNMPEHHDFIMESARATFLADAERIMEQLQDGDTSPRKIMNNRSSVSSGEQSDAFTKMLFGYEGTEDSDLNELCNTIAKRKKGHRRGLYWAHCQTAAELMKMDKYFEQVRDCHVSELLIVDSKAERMTNFRSCLPLGEDCATQKMACDDMEHGLKGRSRHNQACRSYNAVCEYHEEVMDSTDASDGEKEHASELYEKAQQDLSNFVSCVSDVENNKARWRKTNRCLNPFELALMVRVVGMRKFVCEEANDFCKDHHAGRGKDRRTCRMAYGITKREKGIFNKKRDISGTDMYEEGGVTRTRYRLGICYGTTTQHAESLELLEKLKEDLGENPAEASRKRKKKSYNRFRKRVKDVVKRNKKVLKVSSRHDVDG